MANLENRTPAPRLRVTLDASEPTIWRVLDVDPRLTLDRFHLVLQAAFGWRDSHLHDFTDTDPYARGGVEPLVWTDPETIFDGPEGALNEAQAAVGEALEPSGMLFYRYDFGDGWTLRIERLDEPGELDDGLRARVVDGERAGPLDDSGGVPGYADKLELLAGPDCEERREIVNWVGWVCGPWREFAPERFDVEATNHVLARLPGAAPAHDGGDSPSAGPLASLAARLPDGMRPEFWAFVDSAGIEDGPSVPDPADLERMVTPYLWLIGRVGTEGLTLTDAGWLPPAVVREAAEVLNLRDKWIGSATRENSTPPIFHLRESAQRLGLLRKVKGRLTVPRAAQRLLGDPRALWDYVVRAIILRTGHQAAADATVLALLEVAAGRRTERQEVLEAVAFGLGALGWSVPPRGDLTADDARHLLRDANEVLGVLGIELGRFERPLAQTPSAKAFARAALRG